MASKLKVGDLVWAKMKGFPTWPGKIIEPKEDTKGQKKSKSHHFVFFYGSDNYAWVPYETCYPYVGNKEKYMMMARQPKQGYKEAIEAIDDAVKNMSEEERLHAEALPSIDEEIAQIKKRPVSLGGSASNSTLVVKKALKDLEDRLAAPDPVVEEKTRKSEGDAVKSPISNTPGSEKRKKKRQRESEGGEGSPKKTPKLTKEKGSSTKKPRTPKETPNKTDKDSSVKKKPLKAVKALTPSQKIIKKARAVASATVTPNVAATQTPRAISAVSPTKIKPRKIPDLRVSESEYSPLTVGHPIAPISSPSGTQLDHNVMVKPAIKSVIPTPMRIGFLGLGIMGQGMVMNLLRSGHEVTVWNRTTLKCREFVKAGALKGNSPCEVVQACDITFCCVADTTAVKDIVFGSHGVLKGITNGKCYVEMSTIDEDTIQDIAEAITARGGIYLEAPVVGSRVPALEGQLTILASGDRKLFDDCFSCFEAIGKKSLYLGSDPGAATRMKLIVNMVMGSVVASLAEAMAIAEKVGLDQEDVAEVLSLGSLNCPTISHKSQAILNQKYDPHFPLQHQQKDLRLVLQLGDKVEQPLYVAAATNELYKKARRLGYGDSDTSAVFRAASN